MISVFSGQRTASDGESQVAQKNEKINMFEPPLVIAKDRKNIYNIPQVFENRLCHRKGKTGKLYFKKLRTPRHLTNRQILHIYLIVVTLNSIMLGPCQNGLDMFAVYMCGSVAQ